MRESDAAEPFAAQQNLERLLRLHTMVGRINRSLIRADNPHELYAAVCRIAVEDGGFAAAWIGIAEPGSGRIHSIARAGAPIELEALAEIGAESLPAADPIGAAIRDGRPRIVGDAAAESNLRALPQVLREAAVRSLAAFPLALEGREIGAFAVASHQPGAVDEASVALLTEVAADLSYVLETMHQDEKRAAAESRIQYLAYYDSQTGLPGRDQWTLRLAAVCAEHTPAAVLAVNLRSFHGVLQVLGQSQVPGLARAIAGRIEKLFPTSAIGRISESEFAIVVERPEGLHLVEEMAWGISSALAAGVQTDGREVFVDPFVGIALFPKDGADAAETLKAALVAASSGPADAGDSYRFYSDELDHRWLHRLELESALRRAVQEHELVLHYQPQVDLASGLIVGAEALLRWQRPGQGLVRPQDFLPLLEESGLIVAVGEWALEEACRLAKAWQDEGLPPLRMAVKLSARQLQESDLAAVVRRVLHETGLDARWLELEITESIVLMNVEAMVRTLDDLRGLGVSHSLDDFGTGYSSLSYLQRLPVARVKIDRSFIKDITSTPQDAAIVRAVVGMAHNLNLSVIAVGVETEGQLGFLRGLGCDEIQGCFFSQPLPAAEFAALLRENRRLEAFAESAGSKRVLLIVDDETSVLSSLRRLLRQTEIEALTSDSVDKAFNLLATHDVGVVVCDQRMPTMTGTEFLRRVKELYPDAIRIVLSGYTELNSVIDAVNRGAIYKFLTKPWDDQMLLDSLRDAFRTYEMARENRDLTLRLQQTTVVDRPVAPVNFSAVSPRPQS